MKNSGKREKSGDDVEKRRQLKNELDELFKLPLAEFTGARNALATRLKQSGQTNDANLVKALAKPPVSAWTVNQLYWNHRDAFDKLLAAGQRFRQAQTSGKVADMRGSLEARRDALTHLADLAESLLSDAGHNPAQDTIRRITTTLEALSAQTSPADGPTLGRLSQDVDPPGFESLGAFTPGAVAGLMKAAEKPVRSKADARKLEETRQARIAAAKASLQTAKKLLASARATVQTADADAKQAEKQLRQAEERFRKARADAAEATKAVEEAKRDVDKAQKELESLFSESS